MSAPRLNPAFVRTFIGPRGPWLNDDDERCFGDPDSTLPDAPWTAEVRGEEARDK